jgi:hypothetical protein
VNSIAVENLDVFQDLLPTLARGLDGRDIVQQLTSQD